MLKYSSAWGVDSLEIAKEVYDVVAPFWTHEINLASVEKLLELTAAKLGSTPERVERFVDQQLLAGGPRQVMKALAGRRTCSVAKKTS